MRDTGEAGYGEESGSPKADVEGFLHVQAEIKVVEKDQSLVRDMVTWD